MAAERLAVPCACVEVGGGPAQEFEPLLATLDPGCVLLVELTAATAECGELAAGRTAVALVPIDLPGLPADCAPGTRSREWRRFVTDVLAATPDAVEAIASDGFPAERTAVVGSTVVEALDVTGEIARPEPELEPGGYALLTVGRRDVSDEPLRLARVLEAATLIARFLPVAVSSPRSSNYAMQLVRSVTDVEPGLLELPELPYAGFARLVEGAALVLADTFGVAEEAAALGAPWLLVHDPAQADDGARIDTEEIVERALAVLERERTRTPPPTLWDGHAADRIADYLCERAARKPATAGHGLVDGP
jgi:UDP-N-acetylglucosamine 2-epimerase (non-hydrolysing)